MDKQKFKNEVKGGLITTGVWLFISGLLPQIHKIVSIDNSATVGIIIILVVLLWK